jgi:cytosine/adenosine deaminase-related metal-dependent hydrolase
MEPFAAERNGCGWVTLRHDGMLISEGMTTDGFRPHRARRHAADGRIADIGIIGETIAAIEPALKGSARAEIDARGNLVSPPLVDPHFHMDATLSYGIPRINASGTLLEGISLWGELKPLLTHEAVRDRALAYCDWAVSMGLLAIRTHVDVCDDRLLAVEALLDVKKTIALHRSATGRLSAGWILSLADGAPEYHSRARHGRRHRRRHSHFERTMADGTRSVTELCEIAAQRGLMVDLHCDETDDPLSRHIEQLAYETQRLGLQGRVAGSHLTSMHSMDNYYVSKLLPVIAEAGVSAIPNPLINIMLQGRHDTFPNARHERASRRCRPTASASAGARIACSIRGIRWGPPTCSTSPSWACTSPRCRARPTWRAASTWSPMSTPPSWASIISAWPSASAPAWSSWMQAIDRSLAPARRAPLRHRQGQGGG